MADPENPSAHTPGPWMVQDERDGQWCLWTREPHIGTLATFHDEDMNGTFPAKANARLAAASPDLLEACEAEESASDAREECSECEGEGQWEHCGPCSERFGRAIDLRRAAIAKARGAA